MMFSQKIVLSAVLVLASFNFGSAQERKDFDLSLREVVVVDLDHEERFAGEGGPPEQPWRRTGPAHRNTPSPSR